MISQADVIVIGAGALGLSTALHLAVEGAGNVVLLDRFAPGSQTSPRAAGLFKLIQPDETRTKLSALSIQKMLHFETEMNVPLPVIHSGSIILARTEEHAALIREEVTRSQEWGVEVEMISPMEAHRLMPFLEPRDIRAAAYTPRDIYIEEPSDLLSAYLEAATRLGVGMIANTPVTGFRVHQGQIKGVVTPHGEIGATIVVDAAGAWARLVGQMAGGEVPVAPVRHQLKITDPIVGVQEEFPILRIIDSAVYIRPARGGLMLGGFESDPLSLNPGRPGFPMDYVPLDTGPLDRLEATVDMQVPALNGAGTQEHRGGAFTMTPDGRFLVGPVPRVHGLWTATGCNGSGFSSSPGIGQALAEWIVQGEPSIDLTLLDPGRFTGPAMDDVQLQGLGSWQYAHYYDPAASQPAAPTLPTGVS
jgi:glycine/D-amino acid oxidase-like deaminating enzyme